MSKPIIHLLTIDPQDDFCHPRGALFVPGADADIHRLSWLLNEVGDDIDDISVTLDQHQRLHVAHPEFTVDRKGSHPAPFTQMTAAEIVAGDYTTANPALAGMFLSYLQALEGNGRYKYTVWPPHCLIGSPGAAVAPEFFEALNRWALKNFAVIGWVPKGSAWDTEHYSGLQADVPNPLDPTTQLNKRLIQVLEGADELWIAGQAKSHCTANTAADVIDNFSDPASAKKIWLVTDAMSSVPGCDFLWDAFVQKYGSRVNSATTTELAARVKNF